jgi:hypothetical protein
MKKYFLLIFLFFITSCGISKGYYAKVHNSMVLKNYAEADNVILKGKEEYGERNSLLYFLDRGIVLHLQGKYKESNEFFNLAEKRVDELYTIRLSKEAGGLILNDNVIPYSGEDFERVIINVFSSLNYLYLNEWDEALVECRKVDKKLELYNSKYEQKNVYKEDAFIRYLSGLLFEAKGEVNDAFIDYRKSLSIYQDYQKEYNVSLPPLIPLDLIRTSSLLGFQEEHEEYSRKFPKEAKVFNESKKEDNLFLITFLLKFLVFLVF